MSEEQAVVSELSPLEELRKWYHANKNTPECMLALKHRHAMAPGVADELKARAPGETDEERELGLVFSLAQIAEKLDTHAVLLAGIQVEHLPPVVAEATVLACEHVALIEDAAARLSHAHRDLEAERASRAEAEAKLAEVKAELAAERAKSEAVDVVVDETPAEGVAVSHVDVTTLVSPPGAGAATTPDVTAGVGAPPSSK